MLIAKLSTQKFHLESIHVSGQNKSRDCIEWTAYNFDTAISRPGGYEVYELVSNMQKSQKKFKLLQDNFCNQKDILKRGITWTEQKPKGKT